MTPGELSTQLRSKGASSLMELAGHFQEPPERVADLLFYWQRKGRIVKIVAPCPKTCTGCCSRQTVLYRWQEKESTKQEAVLLP